MKKKPPIKKKGSVCVKKLTPPPKESKFWNSSLIKPEGGEPNTKESVTPPIFDKPIRVNNPKQAKKLLSRLIYMLQIDKIESKKAKDLTYLLSVFISIVKETELEERIRLLEERLGTGNGLID